MISKTAAQIAIASEGNPVLAVATVILFFLMFNVLEATVEKLIWGDRFEHWLDPVFIVCAMAYSGYVVMACAKHNTIISNTK